MLMPFLKWVGGKRWLIESGQLELPKKFGTYIEPFLGGGAVFFALRPQKSILSDANQKLIEAYSVLREDAERLQSLLSDHAAKHSDAYYYEMRAARFDCIAERAAQFVYLNRTCFNGIYRENLAGKFNVPRGTKDSVLMDNDNFPAWSKCLENSKILHADFEEAIDQAGSGDLIFADPPYTVRHSNNGFVKYNKKIFSWDDQKRLANSLRAAANRGASFILTNADHASIRELYGEFQMRPVSRRSVISASSKGRSRTTELLVTSITEAR